MNPPPISDPSLPSSNGIDLLKALPELEAKLTALLIPTADEPADMVVSPSIVTNDQPPTIVTAPPLINDDDPDVKVNNQPSLYNDIPAIVKADQLGTLSSELTAIITDHPAPHDTPPVKTLPLSPFTEFPLVTFTDVVLLSRRV